MWVAIKRSLLGVLLSLSHPLLSFQQFGEGNGTHFRSCASYKTGDANTSFLISPSRVLAFDLTEEMLEACQQRLSEFEGRFELMQGDFKTDSFGARYDLIVAGLALHHLEDKDRQEVFSRLYSALKESGIFLAREIVVDTDPFVLDWHHSLWRSFMRANGEDDAFWYSKHQQKDHPVSVERQLAWLQEAGFVHTACYWRYWNFAIISAHKITSQAQGLGLLAGRKIIFS